MLAADVVLPSPRLPLVTAITRTSIVWAMNCRFVRTVRYASAAGAFGVSRVTSCSLPRLRHPGTRGITASTGAPIVDSISLLPTVRSSSRSRSNAAPIPSPKPRIRPSTPSRIGVGEEGIKGKPASATTCVAVS